MAFRAPHPTVTISGDPVEDLRGQLAEAEAELRAARKSSNFAARAALQRQVNDIRGQLSEVLGGANVGPVDLHGDEVAVALATWVEAHATDAAVALLVRALDRRAQGRPRGTAAIPTAVRAFVAAVDGAVERSIAHGSTLHGYGVAALAVFDDAADLGMAPPPE